MLRSEGNTTVTASKQKGAQGANLKSTFVCQDKSNTGMVQFVILNDMVLFCLYVTGKRM